MNPEAANPTPADDQPVTDVARRVGPPLVVAALLLTGALLAWLAVAPTAIAGPLSEAPFTVPATLVVPPDDDGCLRLVEGDGTAREHCFDELATDRDDDFRHVEAFFDDQGRLLAGERPELLHLDPATGEVLGTVDVSEEDLRGDAPPRPLPEDDPIESPEPPEDGPPPPEVIAEGDRVLRWDFGEGREPDEEDVVLDLEAPPGYRLETALLSPDGAWVVALTPDQQVVVAPADRSAAPYVWTEVPDDRWIDPWRAIRWDS